MSTNQQIIMLTKNWKGVLTLTLLSHRTALKLFIFEPSASFKLNLR